MFHSARALHCLPPVVLGASCIGQIRTVSSFCANLFAERHWLEDGDLAEPFLDPSDEARVDGDGEVDFDLAGNTGDGGDLLRGVPDELGDDRGGVAPEEELHVFGFAVEEGAEGMSQLLLRIEAARLEGASGEAELLDPAQGEGADLLAQEVVGEEVPAEVDAGEVERFDAADAEAILEDGMDREWFARSNLWLTFKRGCRSVNSFLVADRDTISSA